MRSLFEFNIDYKHVDEVANHLKFKSKDLKSYVNSLPEIKCCKELISRKFSEDTIVKYIFYVAINDWNLTNVHYQNSRGAEALWRCVKDSLLELKKFSIEDLTEKVLSKLRGDKKRFELFKSCVKVLETSDLSGFINDIVRRKEISLDSLSEVLKRVYRKHLDEVFKKYYGITSTEKIPINKVINLIARTCSRALNYNVQYNEQSLSEQSILYDVHVAKVTLRLGLVKPIPRSSTRYFGIGFPLFGVRELKQSVIKAWRLISEKSGVHVWDIDAMLWIVGREACIFDDESRAYGERINSVSCPLKAVGREPDKCILKEVCRSYVEDIGIRILSARQTGGREIAILINELT